MTNVRIWYPLSYELEDKDAPNSPVRAHRKGISSIAVHPQREREFLTGGRDGSLCLWRWQEDENGPQLLERLDKHTRWIHQVSFLTPNLAASVSSDSSVRMWTLNPNDWVQPVAVLNGHKEDVYALSPLDAEGTKFVTVGAHSEILFWDTVREQQEWFAAVSGTHVSNPISLRSVAVDQSAKILACAGVDGVISLWDPRTPAEVGRLHAHVDCVRCLNFGGVGQSRLLSGSSDGAVYLWDRRLPVRPMAEYKANGSIWAMTPVENVNRTDYLLSVTRPPLEIGTTRKRNTPWKGSLLSLHVDTKLRPVEDQAFDTFPSPVLSIACPSWSKYRLIGLEDGSLKGRISNDNVQNKEERTGWKIESRRCLDRLYVFRDRRRALVSDREGNIELWDLYNGVCTKEYGTGASFSSLTNELDSRLYVPKWLIVNIELGIVSLYLEYPALFSAEEYVHNVDPLQEVSSAKINLAGHVLRSALDHFVQKLLVAESKYGESQSLEVSIPILSKTKKEDESEDGKSTTITIQKKSRMIHPDYIVPLFHVSENTRVAICENTGGFPIATTISKMSDNLLTNNLHPWLLDYLLNNAVGNNDLSKIQFELLPLDGRFPELTMESRGVMSAPHVMKMEWVKEFVCKSLTRRLHRPFAAKDIELKCNSTILQENLDLGTVYHYEWNAKGPMILNYSYVIRAGMAKLTPEEVTGQNRGT